MGAWTAVRDLVELLRLVPDAVIANDHIGSSVPSTSVQLPSIAVALADVHESPSSLGGLAGTARISDDAWSERRIVRTNGIAQIAMYAASAAALDALTSAVMEVLSASESVRAGGFLGFSILSVGAGAETSLGRAQQTGAFARTVECSFVHEEQPSTETGPGGLIRQVHVEMHEQFHEVMDVTK